MVLYSSEHLRTSPNKSHGSGVVHSIHKGTWPSRGPCSASILVRESEGTVLDCPMAFERPGDADPGLLLSISIPFPSLIR